MRKHSPASKSPDAIIAALAGRQHGVVSRAQLLRAGISAKAIDGRLARGQLHPLHRGVFQVGPIMAARAREMAAHLACGASSRQCRRGSWSRRSRSRSRGA